jgi:hypothetical protein
VSLASALRTIPLYFAIWVSALVWLVLVAAVAFRARSSEDTGWMAKALVAASAALALLWTINFLGPDLSREASGVSQASVQSPNGTAKRKSRPGGTCSSIRVGMTAEAVREALGEPDRIKSIEDLRGPKAESWTYDDVVCGVHVVQGVVEFVE